jgi:hypothetical protein
VVLLAGQVQGDLERLLGLDRPAVGVERQSQSPSRRKLEC